MVIMSINKQDNWQVIDQCNCLQFKDEEGQKKQKNGSSVEYNYHRKFCTHAFKHSVQTIYETGCLY